MMDSRQRCPEGWDPAELLSYVEGELAPDDVRELEEHLGTCAFCSTELESLRKLDVLLRRYPEAFHPEKDILYRYASTGEDIGGRVEAHILSCPGCAEEVQTLREMVNLRDSSGALKGPLPPALAREFERTHGTTRTRKPEGAFAFWRRKLSELPSSIPVLTLGTAAAVLIIAVLTLPMWEALKEVPQSGVHIQPAAPAGTLPEPGSEIPRAAPEKEAAAPTPQMPAKQMGAGPKLEDKGEGVGRVEQLKRDKPLPTDAPKPSSPVASAVESQKETESRPDRALGPEAKRKRELPPRSAPPMESAQESPEFRDKLGETREADSVRFEKRALGTKSAPGTAERLDGRIPVEVRIVDAQGHDLRDVPFVPPEDESYTFYRGTPESSPKEMAARADAKDFEDGKRARVIIIIVAEEGNHYRLQGQVFSGDSKISERTVNVEGIRRADLEKQIQALVSSLVAAY
jgi:anti-sigma factor RsiW